MKKPTLLLFAILMFVPLAFSQDPTYDQTRKWIVSKLSDEAGNTIQLPGDLTLTTSYATVSMDNCRLQFTSVLFSSGMSILAQQPTVTYTAFVIPLDKVTSVKRLASSFQGALSEKSLTKGAHGDYYSVEILTSAKIITMTSTEKQGDKVLSQEVDPPTDRELLTFGRSPATDEDLADRMQKALSHAVSLCMKPQEKEPF